MEVNLRKIANEQNISYFKQFNVYQTLKFSTKTIDINKATHSEVKIKIISTKYIDTFKGTSIEGQCLTGKKLIILGILYMKLLIPRKECSTNMYIRQVKIPFSTFIIVPEEICQDQPVNLAYSIEDVTVKAITTNSILASSTILLQFIDEYI